MVRAALAGAGKTQKELAEHMGWTPQNLSGRLKNNSLTFDELSKALHFAGYEVSMSDANGAGLPELGNSTSPAVAQTVDGVRYDTRKAESARIRPRCSRTSMWSCSRMPLGTTSPSSTSFLDASIIPSPQSAPTSPSSSLRGSGAEHNCWLKFLRYTVNFFVKSSV